MFKETLKWKTKDNTGKSKSLWREPDILNPISTRGVGGGISAPFKHFYIIQRLAKLVNWNFVAFHKIYLVTFTRRKIHQWAPQEPKASSWYFKKVDSSGYIIYYISLESIFFPDFKKGIWNSNYLILSSYLSRIDIIDLASSRPHMYVRLWYALQIMTSFIYIWFHAICFGSKIL